MIFASHEITSPLKRVLAVTFYPKKFISTKILQYRISNIYTPASLTLVFPNQIEGLISPFLINTNQI